MRIRETLEMLSILGPLVLSLLVACGDGASKSGSQVGQSGGGPSTGTTRGSGAQGDDVSVDASSVSVASGAASGSVGGDASASTGDDAGNSTSTPADGSAGLGDTGSATRRSCKRGIAANGAPKSAFAPTRTSPGVSWWYNWALTGSGQDPAIEFVPMVWGSSTAGSTLPAGSRFVLGFNEPNFKSQANLSPQQAATAWPMIEAHAKATGAAILSPAVNYCGSSKDSSQCTVATITDPYTYLKDFFSACAGCQVDCVAVHWYNCDLPSLEAYIEGNTDAGGGLQGFVQFGKPIWLTEFSCDGSHSVADQMAYMKAAVPYLESNRHVARYSWFSAGPIANAQLANADGTLTALGQTYVSLPESCP
jgi:hypothetical protein